MTKLTNRQAETLINLRDHGPRPAFMADSYPVLFMNTLISLYHKGLVASDMPPSSFWPSSTITWSTTDAGRAALSESSK